MKLKYILLIINLFLLFPVVSKADENVLIYFDNSNSDWNTVKAFVKENESSSQVDEIELNKQEGEVWTNYISSKYTLIAFGDTSKVTEFFPVTEDTVYSLPVKKVKVYFDNSETNWSLVLAVCEDADGDRINLGQLIKINEGLYEVDVPETAKIIYFQNYLPGTPAEYAPSEGFLISKTFDFVENKVYKYEPRTNEGITGGTSSEDSIVPPETSDNIGLWISLLVISSVSIITLRKQYN